MRVIEFSRGHATPITLFESVAAASVALGDGKGEVHVYCVYLGRDSQIGPHPAGFGQLWLVVDGDGWAAGADGYRVALAAGQGVSFARGEVHAKGSETGMTVIMIQIEKLEPSASAVANELRPK